MDEDFNVRYVGKGHGKRAYKVSDRNPHWKNVFKKHKPIVDFVAIKLTEKEALDLEVEMINIYREDGYKLCNLTEGGEGTSGLKPSDETRNKISEAHKGEKCYWYGKQRSAEMRHKISEANKGKQTFLGKQHSEESKNKISEAKKGKKHTAETCKKISESRYGEKNGRAKITVETVLEIKRLLSEGKKVKNIGIICCVPDSMVWSIKYGKTWKHLNVEDK